MERGAGGADPAERLGVPVAVDTDVNGAALGEWRWGAARDCDPALYLTVGTGIGGGIVLDGRPLHGLLHPEMGHIPLPRLDWPDGRPDDFPGACPFHGACFEGLASGPALAARAGVPAETLDPEHPLWELAAGYVALALATYVLVLAPRRIVVGGGVSRTGTSCAASAAGCPECSTATSDAPRSTPASTEYVVPPLRAGGGAGRRPGPGRDGPVRGAGRRPVRPTGRGRRTAGPPGQPRQRRRPEMPDAPGNRPAQLRPRPPGGLGRRLRSDARVRVVCAWDEDPARGRAAAAAVGVPFEPSLERVLAREDVQAVTICATNDAHADLAVAAARRRQARDDAEADGHHPGRLRPHRRGGGARPASSTTSPTTCASIPSTRPSSARWTPGPWGAWPSPGGATPTPSPCSTPPSWSG